MPLWLLFFSALPLMMAIFALTWVVQRYFLKHDDAGIVDMVWGLSAPITVVYYAIMIDGDPVRQALVIAMASAWGLRLAWFMYSTRIVGQPEDTRYAQMRVDWGDRVQLWFFAFFQIQAVGAWLMGAGFVVLMASVEPLSWFDPLTILGLALFIIAILGEMIADNQLSAFKRNPANKGKVCRQGLWAYSRHPNYFFECLVWVSFVPLGITLASGWVTLVPAAVILFFLTRFSGIPNNEQQNLRSKPEAYKKYQAEVSAFIPWFPKRGNDG